MKTTFGLPKKREQVINMLQQAYIDQNLEDEEYENRLKAAMDAKSVEELQVVISDFPGSPQLLERKKEAPKSRPSISKGFNFNYKSPNAAPNAPANPHLERIQKIQERITNIVSTENSKQSIALLGSKTLNISEDIYSPLRLATYLGEQRVSLQQATIVGDTLVISVDTGMGSTVIDLRGYNLKDKHVQINLMVIMGEVSILLPKGAQVNNRVTPILGEVNHRYQKVKKWIKKLIGGRKEVDIKPIPYTISLYGSCILGEVALVHD